MSLHPFTHFCKTNQRLILLLVGGHLLWSCTLFGLDSVGGLFTTTSPWWSGVFIAVQLYIAAQLLLPALLLHPEQRNRGFYYFWAITLALSVWLINQLSVSTVWQPLLTSVKSGLLLLVATLIGATLARYVNKLWEIVPICIVMTLADFVSWSYGPTAAFTRQIEQYYRTAEGPPPLIDMLLIKLVFPGPLGLAPLFGISDWIMVALFAIVAQRYAINDNLLGRPGKILALQGQIGYYLPVSVVALFIAILLAQSSGMFIPALPLIALIVLLWYAGRYLLVSQTNRN